MDGNTDTRSNSKSLVLHIQVFQSVKDLSEKEIFSERPFLHSITQSAYIRTSVYFMYMFKPLGAKDHYI